jgi:curved DNA-binding protein
MEYKDYYKILGVPRTASQADVKKAFRKLAREHHPDVKPGDSGAERRFKDVNEAHAVLSDPAKRSQYDALGENWQTYAQSGGGGNPFGPGGPFAGFGGFDGRGGNVRYEFRTTGGEGGFSDFFRTFFGGAPAGPSPSGQSASGQSTAGRRSAAGTRTAGGASFEEILGEMGFDAPGVGTRTRPAGDRGERVVEANAELTLEEAFHGTTRIVEIDGKRLEVSIPRGVDTGSRVRVPGRGGDGRDLHVVVTVRPHPVFTRRGADLERELLISLEEALLGAEVPVTTLRSRVLLRIPAGTQNGRTFRLKGQGMPRLNGDGTGDLYVKVRVVLPAGLSEEAATAARAFLDLADQPDPRASAN